VKLAYPREKGEVEPRIVSSVAYRILRGKINQDDHQNWKSWRVVRCDANASEGLIQGWGWGLGERTLDKSTLESLNAMLSELPEYIKAIESTPIQLSAFWGETAESELKVIKQHLEKFITYKL
jgi:hypothetical protein